MSVKLFPHVTPCEVGSSDLEANVSLNQLHIQAKCTSLLWYTQFRLWGSCCKTLLFRSLYFGSALTFLIKKHSPESFIFIFSSMGITSVWHFRFLNPQHLSGCLRGNTRATQTMLVLLCFLILIIDEFLNFLIIIRQITRSTLSY